MKKGTCAWILSQACKLPVEYCGRPTGYVMARDAETDKQVRVYHTFCPEHLKRAEEED